MMDNQVYVITGATSFIASGLLRRLVAEGKKIYAICRPDSKCINRIPQSDNIIRIYCELSELYRVEEKINEKCDVFFHLGWSTTEKNNMYLQNLNVKYTLDAVQISKNLGCHTFIGAGSQAEYGITNVKLTDKTPTFPVSGYGIAKLCAGQMSRELCKTLKLNYIWARIVSVYGPMEPETTMLSVLINGLKRGQPVNLSNCQQIWDYMYIDDCAEAMYLMAQIGTSINEDIKSEIFVLGSGQARPLFEYVQLVKDMVNRRGIVNIGAISRSTQTPMYLHADTEKLKEKLGFFSKFNFSKGIKQRLEFDRSAYERETDRSK